MSKTDWDFQRWWRMYEGFGVCKKFLEREFATVAWKHGDEITLCLLGIAFEV